jgi:hypothetical protein
VRVFLGPYFLEEKKAVDDNIANDDDEGMFFVLFC